MSSSERSSDYGSISQGPSERFERWGQGRRRAKYRAWPPTNAPSYPVWKRYHMFRNMEFETMRGTSSDGESDMFITPNEASLKARWQEIAERKIEIYATRCRIKKAKSRTEEARQKRDIADNTFMSIIRPTQVYPMTSSAHYAYSLQAQFQRMQSTRDKYHENELVMLDLERNLEEAGDELDLLERRLINALRHPTRDDTTREPFRVPVPEQPQSDVLRGLEIEPAKGSNSSYQRLLLALRSVDLARKHRVELVARRARLNERQRLLGIFEKYHPAALQYITRLESNDLEFLIHFEAEERRISGQMRVWREEVVRLSWECELIPQGATLEDVQSWYPEDFSIDLDLGYDHMEAESTKPTDFPILLSNPIHLLEDFPITAEGSLKRATRIPEGHPLRAAAIDSAAKEFSIQNLVVDAEDTPNFINRWLLQNLRTSRREVGALYSSCLASGNIGIVDIEKWQWDVLQNWWEDEAHMRMLEHFRPAQTSWVSATPTPPSWLSEPFLYTWDSDVSDLESVMMEYAQSEVDETNSQASGDEAPWAQNNRAVEPSKISIRLPMPRSIRSRRTTGSTLSLSAGHVPFKGDYHAHLNSESPTSITACF